MAWDALIVLLPGLPGGEEDHRADIAERWPTLARWLARGERHRGARDPYEALGRHLGITAHEGRLPSATLTCLGDFGDCPPGHWLAADPVHLAADLSDAILLPGSQVGIDELEAQALTTALNEHFREEGLEFRWQDPARWYLQLKSAPGITTTPLWQVAGRPVQAFLPAGPQAGFWRRVLTEAQMLLHAHEVNAARETDGRPPINGIWLWGEDGLPEPPDPLWYLYGEDPVLDGLSRLQVREPLGLPRAETILTSPQSTSSRALIWLTGQAPSSWEEDWFVPLDRGLRDGLIGRLAVDTASGYVYALTRWTRWRFWRRSR